MATPSENSGHVHTYKRVLKTGRKSEIFACTNPHCTHTRNADFLVGKAAICPYCDEEFIITRLKLNKQGLLHCDNCTRKGRKVTKTSRLETELERILLFGIRHDITPVQNAESIPDEITDDSGSTDS